MPVPEHVRLFRYRNAAGYPVLNQQGVTHQLQNLGPVATGAAMRGQLRCERFDHAEHFRDIALVTGKCHALGQGVGDEEHSRQRHVSKCNRSARGDLVLRACGDLDERILFLGNAEPAHDTGRNLVEKYAFFFRREANQDRDAIAKQHRNAVLPVSNGQRHRREYFTVVADRVDAVAEMKGVDRNATFGLQGFFHSGSRRAAGGERALNHDAISPMAVPILF